MKKIITTLCCLIVTYFSFSQWDTKKYNDFWHKGDSLYDAKDYKNSALAYSSALAMSPGYASPWESWITARSWCRANHPDSAFFSLNLANSKEITYSNLNDILTDKDLIPLHNDKRWGHFKDEMFLNAYKTLLVAQKEAGGKFITPTQNDTAFAFALGNNADSAFSNLNKEAYQFLKKKMFEKAYTLFKVSIHNFPPNYTLNQNMMDYYIGTGDMERAYVYFSRSELVKYKQPAIVSDSSLKIDSAIKSEYRDFSIKTGYEALPPEYLVSTIANALLKKGMTDKAYVLFKMNLNNWPHSYTLYQEIGNFYTKRGDKEKANEYFSKSLTMQYKLPKNFFDSSFIPQEYIKSYYQNLSKKKGQIVLPPLLMINNLYNYYLTEKKYGKAEALIKLNLENYPKSWDGFARMSDFYRTMGDNTKADQFKRQSITLKNIYLPENRNGVLFIADSTFDTNVITPVCSTNCPTILIDEAHNNSGLTATDKYSPFATLMTNDGFNIIRGKTPFTKQLLSKTNVIFIGAPKIMTDIEIQILKDWIINGGSLLAVTDHDNWEIDGLLKSLGVETNDVSITRDSLHGMFALDRISPVQAFIVFKQEDKLLGNHVILKGRNQIEKINCVQTFSGRSIVGPPGSSVLLQLSKSAVDFMKIDEDNFRSRLAVKTKGLRSHGIAFTFGKGKIVVISENATLTALLLSGEEYRTIDEFGKIGMNTPGSDNKQFALNIMRWLTSYLK